MENISEESSKVLKSTFKIYHERHVIKYNNIISDISEYLHTYEPDYCIKNTTDKIHDDDESILKPLIEKGNDGTHVMDITSILSVCRNFMDSEVILDTIKWYLETYQPEYVLIKL